MAQIGLVLIVLEAQFGHIVINTNAILFLAVI